MGNSTISTTEARWVGSAVEWSQVDREGYLLAMERSPVRDVEIKALLKPAFTDAADDRDADPERDAGGGAARW